MFQGWSMMCLVAIIQKSQRNRWHEPFFELSFSGEIGKDWSKSFCFLDHGIISADQRLLRNLDLTLMTHTSINNSVSSPSSRNVHVDINHSHFCLYLLFVYISLYISFTPNRTGSQTLSFNVCSMFQSIMVHLNY